MLVRQDFDATFLTHDPLGERGGEIGDGLVLVGHHDDAVVGCARSRTKSDRLDLAEQEAPADLHWCDAIGIPRIDARDEVELLDERLEAELCGRVFALNLTALAD